MATNGIRNRASAAPVAARALASAGVPYAVVGGNAVAAWVSRVDTAAVRNTQGVDILLRRADMETARAALEGAGFVHRRVTSLGKRGTMDVFLDGPDAKVREAVHVIWVRYIGEGRLAEIVGKVPGIRDAAAAHGIPCFGI